MIKVSGLFLMLVSFAGLASILKCDNAKPIASTERQSNRAAAAATSTAETKEKPGIMEGEIKQLAGGNHCTVFESFVFVARDVRTYQALQSLNVALPDQDTEFFKSHAVVAAFLGQRRTGGFAVDITQDADGVLQVVEHTPKGMVTMALTAPFKIVAVPVKPDEPISLSLDGTWKERLRTYRVTSGALTITGGFAGVHESSGLEGSLQIMRASGSQPLPTGKVSSPTTESLATFMFELKSTGKRQTQLRDVASGTVSEPGGVTLACLDSHALSGAIQSPFKATGQFTNDERDLSLNLETVPSPHVSDNFSAQASLKATATSPRPPNRAVTGDE